ncbi:C6 zinc finger domain-containing protein [Dactylonectria macrodidyma]|uniref:C6 zinc finger domain-containing protein n=1 Tax=Dactylonectria macrodidyma TaxID=307937 RepID=A0A9P9EBA7_9HYPO|nr:C6 zinc finger domain-containing protein [Dactylonectria macrodidyma]
MPLRLGYKKSRGGCQRCKKRRVKCDEKQPCTACIKHSVTCSLVEDVQVSPPPSESRSRSNIPQRMTRASRKSRIVSPTDPFPYFGNRLSLPAAKSVFGETWTTDLELMHHFTVTTCLTLPRADKLKQIWQIEVPKSGMEYPFVLHQILVVAALHLGYLRPNERQRLCLHASRHQSEGVAGLRKNIANITPESCEALFSASTLLTLSAYATFSQPKGWLDAAVKPTIGDIIDIFSLARGMNQLLACCKEALQRGSFSSIFELQPQTGPTTFLAELVVQLESLRVKISSHAHEDILSREIGWLISWIQRCSNTTNGPELRITMTWPIDLSADYMSLLQQKEPWALTLLAYYCAVVSTTESTTWYTKNWSMNALRAITDCLDPAWAPHIAWPSSIIKSL